ncbi:MAG: hypothetical protein AAF267_15905 [Deinococcota bacterium]
MNTVSLRKLYVLMIVGLGFLVGCQQQVSHNPQQDVVISSPLPVQAGVVNLELPDSANNGEIDLEPLQNMIHVSHYKDGALTVAWVTATSIEGDLFTLPEGAVVRSSNVISQDTLQNSNLLTQGTNTPSIVSQQNPPTAGVTVSHALEASFVDASLGDLDANGFTLIDIVRVLEIVVGNSEPVDARARYHADVTCNGSIDITDVLFLLRKLVGITQDVPICPADGLSVSSGQPRIILLGNPGMEALTDAPTITAPAGMTVTDVSSDDAFGIALEISATVSGTLEVEVGGTTLNIQVSVTDVPPAGVLNLQLVGAETQENASIVGLPLNGASLPIP